MNLNFWGTYFHFKKLDEAEAILEKWDPFLSDDSYISENGWNMAQVESSIRSENNEDLPWKSWLDIVEPIINNYLQTLEPMMPYSLKCEEKWFNKYSTGDYQEPHDHAFPGRGLSSIYVLDYPKDEKDPGGQLVFECPNFPIIRSSGLDVIFNAWNCQHFVPPLEKGTLIIFPSWISHYVLPSKTDKRRATISANFAIEPLKEENK